MRLAVMAIGLLCAVGLALTLDVTELAHWAVERQRAFQNEIAAAVRALRSGAPGASAALLGAAAAYGFVHAVGPGHGKYLVGGVGLGTAVPAMRLVGLALAASVAQAIWAILLVYGAFFLLDVSARSLPIVAEDYLAPASYVAIGGIGSVLAWRGARAWARTAASGRGADGETGCRDHACGCHAHGPTREEIGRATTLREAAALVLGIAVRPCTGAVFLLVIAWQMEIRIAGAAAVLAMGLGTALLTCLVAVLSVGLRGAALASTGAAGLVAFAGPSLQMLAGAAIVWFSLVLLGASLA